MLKKYKIAIDLRTLETATGKRGIGYWTKKLVNELIKIHQADIEYIFYTTLTHRPELDLELARVKYSFVGVPTLYRPRRGLRRSDLVMSRVWQTTLMLTKPDLLHLPSLHEVYYLELPKDIKTVVTVYDLIPLIFPGRFFKDKIASGWYVDRLEQLKSLASKVLTISEASKRDLVRLLKLPSAKVEVTLGGLDPRFKLLPKDLVKDRLTKRYKINHPFILAVGAYSFHKNIPALFQAFKKYLQISSDKQTKLVVVCKLIPEELKAWQQTLAEEGLTDKVVLTNFVSDEDMPIFYNGAEIFIFPSLYEGFGLPILESFACQTPVITSKNSSLPEAGGEAIVYIDPKDINQMAQSIQKLLNDKKLQQQLIKKGLMQLKKFSWEGCAKQTLEVYRQVLAER